jgi:hypothetical protein
MHKMVASAGANFYIIFGEPPSLCLRLQSTGLLVWFLIPRFREGEFGGRFWVDVNDLPDVNAPRPISQTAVSGWLA